MEQCRHDEHHPYETAEALWEGGAWPDYGDTDVRSIAFEVLAQLDILNHQLITVEDVPTLVSFLDTASGKTANGWMQCRQYWDSIDWNQRRLALASHPYSLARQA